MHVRVKGNLSEGFEAIGPYADFGSAAADGDGWVMEMQFSNDLDLPEGLYLTRNKWDGDLEIRDEQDVTRLRFPRRGHRALVTRVCAVLGISQAWDWGAEVPRKLSIEEFVNNAKER